MARTKGSTSFITVPLATLQAEIAAGYVPDMVIVGKTWWLEHQMAKVEAGGVAPVTFQAPAATAGENGGNEVVEQDDTPLEIV